MQWDVIVEDLLAQLEQSERLDVQGMAGELRQAEIAQTTVPDRLRAQDRAVLRCGLLGGLSLTGTCTRVGGDWFLLDAGPVEALIPLHAVVTLEGLATRAQEALGVVALRLGLASVIRGVADRRAAVVAHLCSGTTVEGVVWRVGQDHLELRVADAEEPRSMGRSITLMYQGLAALSSRTGVGE